MDYTAEQTDEILTITPTGALDRDRVVGIVDRHYRGLHLRSVVWDLRKATVDRMGESDFQIVARVVKALTPPNSQRKTAFVVSDMGTYVRMCGYLNQTMQARLSAEYAVFQDMAAARTWVTTE